MALAVIAFIAVALLLNAVWPNRRLMGISFISWFLGWLVTEAPLHTASLLAGAAAVAVATQGLHTPIQLAALSALALSLVGLIALFISSRATNRVLGSALTLELPALDSTWRKIVRPYALVPASVERIRQVPYFEDEKLKLTLDVFRRREAPAGPAFIYVHGGAWVAGSNRVQGLPLLHHLAAQGWVCFSINYRLSPRYTFPAALHDVKRAIDFVRRNGEQWGAQPSFVAIAGASAGGHLATLAALTPQRLEFQPGFETADTHVDACVSLYGVYDFLDRHRDWPHSGLQWVLRLMVMKATREAAPEAYAAASPMSYLNVEAPPFLVLHGSKDSMAPVAQARRFARELKAISRAPVDYAELPGAQHAFDVFPSVRALLTVRAIELFLERTRKG